MCEQCSAKTLFYVNKRDNIISPLSGFSLVRATKDGNFMKEGEWGLVECNDPSFTFTTTPYPEPYFDDNSSDEEFNTWEEWFNAAEKFSEELKIDYDLDQILGIDHYYRLAISLEKSGYDREKDGKPSLYLFDLLGKFIDIASIVDDEELARMYRGDEYKDMDLTIRDFKIGDLVKRKYKLNDEDAVEYGIVIACWYNPDIKSQDCMLAIYGDKIPKSKPTEYQPHFKTYCCESLEAVYRHEL